ncbi:fusion protein [Ectropis obliqua nucleopolyhedrovirus]|uniref:Fusion protein n=1 Tax=Ectropis obliqua nucleopolyhedrovirus TaxID=59376 RepID=A0EZ21_9ABAC|nr:fusion protein [Ectropis obliqua nucleopolyhedrovirus]ABI35801.1 fusion protein [Ectropis obliqua nucleopolyhedrovirus]AGS47860.1 envelope fusion protein [Ectropis obliqua nucleopolyhedrovirus]QWV59706.1 fusion protein [Ectropis obliqua nucleopolyhedrovirus]UYO72914.1 fusion protein [Ectropis obliqua nucleopolyhedrovirus]
MFEIVHKIIVWIVVCNILFANASSSFSSDDVITVKLLPHTSGFYYQPINKMQFVENLWTFVVEIDHGIIFKELNLLYNETHKFIDFINTHNVNNCTQKQIFQVEVQSYLIKKILKLVENHNDLDSKIPKAGSFGDHLALKLDHESVVMSKRRRRKRGLLNFVGSVDKFLFGVMDNNDAHLLHNVAKNENALNVQVKQLTDELITIANFIEHNDCVENEKHNVCVYAEAKINLLKAQIDEIAMLYTRLDRAVDDALSNKINSMIMTPKRLLGELMNVTNYLPPKMTWSVPLKLDNMHHLINNRIVKSHVFITKERKLLFIVEVPLINQQVYNVYQVVPIPFCVNTKCAVIVPNSKYLGISSSLTNYVRLDSDATNMCKLTVDNLLCYKPKIVYSSNEATLCDIRILLDNYQNSITNVAHDCDVRVGKFDDAIFYQISEYNQWLYVLQRDTRVSFDCDNKHLVTPLILKTGVGIISGKNLNFSCQIITPKAVMSLVQIKTNLLTTTTMNLPILTSFNLSAALQNFDKFELENFKPNTNLDYNDLTGMTQRLTELRQQMNNNTMFNSADINDDDDNWFCYIVSFIGLNCRRTETVFVYILLFIATCIIFRVYKCMCPGLCTELWSSCKRDKPTVVQVDSNLQYIGKKQKNLAVGYHVANANDSDEDEMNGGNQVFVKSY